MRPIASKRLQTSRPHEIVPLLGETLQLQFMFPSLQVEAQPSEPPAGAHQGAALRMYSLPEDLRAAGGQKQTRADTQPELSIAVFHLWERIPRREEETAGEASPTASARRGVSVHVPVLRPNLYPAAAAKSAPGEARCRAEQKHGNGGACRCGLDTAGFTTGATMGKIGSKIVTVRCR